MGWETSKRGALLLVIVGLAIGLVACGRATESDILSAVGITPTATRSSEELATATAAAIAQQTEEAAAAASPASEVAALGDVNRGRGTFSTWCQNCHRPGGGGSGPDLFVAGGPAAGLTLDAFTVLMREGTNHPPGPYRTSDFSDRQVGDLLAYILAESNQ